jgi:hypothetical protein
MSRITVLPHHTELTNGDSPRNVEVYRSTVTVLIEVPDGVPADLREAWAYDAMSEGMRGLHDFVDWAYVDGPTPVTITDPYIEGTFK